MRDATDTVVPFPDPSGRQAGHEARIRALEAELAGVRAELRAAEAALDSIDDEFRSTNDALRWVNAELRLIFDRVPVAIVLCSADGAVVNANAVAHRWLGVPDSALLGRPYFRYIPESCRERVRNAHGRAVDIGVETTSDVHRLDVPGQPPRWLRTVRVPFRNEGTGAPMLLLVSEDCTARREEEQRTEFFRSRMELALGASKIGMWDKFLETGETFWSERLKEMLGEPKSFVPVDGAFLARVHPEDAERFERAERERLAGGEPYTLRVRVVRPDGEVRWVARSGRRYERGGGPARVTGTVVDETEIVSQLRRSDAMNEQMRLAERLSRTGYWSLSLGGRAELYWSDQVWSIHGLDPAAGEQCVERSFGFYHPEDVEHVRTAFAATLERGLTLDYSARIVRPCGEIRHVSVLGIVQGEGTAGDARTLFGVIADVTEMTERELSLRVAHDALARSNEELARFGYVCSHDMKEPVRLIESMSAVLLSGDPSRDPEQTRQLLTRINANTMRLRAIIDSLLAYSRVEARIESGPVELERVAVEVRENLAIAIAEKGATLEIGPLPIVHGARVHFVQLLQNLVGNALAYSHRAAPRVRVRAEPGDGATVLTVEDDGPGIPAAERARVFEVFTRLALTSAVEGTGLGLSICARIVQQYGGRIDCVDGGLGGAAFRIELPETQA